MLTPLKVQKVTPILVVEDIASSVAFWIRLGFEKTVEVPEAGGVKLGFVVLVKDAVEIMYQSRRSVLGDIPAVGSSGASSLIYLEVSTLEPIIEQTLPTDIVVARRTAAYGADEIFVREPGGHIIGFAVQSQ